MEHVFRYAGVFRQCLEMIATGRIDVTPLITRTFSFNDSIEAFDLASRAANGEVKMQIVMD